jgi:hypothetical protein
MYKTSVAFWWVVDGGAIIRLSTTGQFPTRSHQLKSSYQLTPLGMPPHAARQRSRGWALSPSSHRPDRPKLGPSKSEPPKSVPTLADAGPIANVVDGSRPAVRTGPPFMIAEHPAQARIGPLGRSLVGGRGLRGRRTIQPLSTEPAAVAVMPPSPFPSDLPVYDAKLSRALPRNH